MGKRIAIAGIAGTAIAASALLAGCGTGSAKSDATAPVAATAVPSQSPTSTTPSTPSTSAPSSAASTTSAPTSSPSTASATTTPSGKTTTQSSVPKAGKALTLASVTPTNGQTVGVGMPVRVTFTSSVPTADRAAVERAMTVTTSNHVSGAWSWLNSTTVDFRPQAYWPAQTQVSVHLDLASVKTPDGAHGTAERDLSFTVGDDREAYVDVVKHEMAVVQDGKTVRVMPIGAGKPGDDTDSGTMAVLEKVPVTTMTSCSIGLSCTPGQGDYYSLTVHNAVRLTWQGIFVHQAEWDANIGKDNTSHGCIHLNPDDAAWFYDFAQVGDPVKVLNSPRTVNPTNGFGDYTLSWSQWLGASATGAHTT